MRFGRAFIGFAPALIVFFASTAGRAEPPDRPTYAEQCAKEMGAIRAFNCMDGAELEITVGGQKKTKSVAKCDRPVQLDMLKSVGQCVPFSRLQAIDTGKPTVLTLALCRKYFDRKVTEPDKDPRFDDVAVIQHDKATGRTCFFQSEVNADVTEPGHDGRRVPSPSERSAAADAFWMSTNDVAGTVGCTKCHAADPFVWSPYVEPRIDLDRWNPQGRYDSNFANLFGRPATTFSPAGNACIGCHRFGRGPNANSDPDPKKSKDNACKKLPHDYVAFNKAHATKPGEVWMPTGFSGTPAQWRAQFTSAMEQIDRCCANPDQIECRSDIADGRIPRTEKGEILRTTGAACGDAGCPGWQRLDNDRKTIALAASDATLYQLRDNGEVWRSTNAACSGDNCAGWTRLDRNPTTIAIAAGAGVLYQLRNDGTILRFSGTPCSNTACPGWQPVGNDTKTVAIAMGGIQLYRLDRDGGIWTFTGPACTKNGRTGWRLLDNNPSTVAIAAAPEALYQLHDSGLIWRYTGTPCNADGCAGWQAIDNNPNTVAIAAGTSQLYQLHDTGAIFRFNGVACSSDGCTGWRQLDGNPSAVAITAAGKNLYQLHDDGKIWRFTGALCSADVDCPGWEMLDNHSDTTVILAGGDRLYQLRQEQAAERRAERRPRPFGMAAARPR